MLVLDYPRATSAAEPWIAIPPFHTGHLGFVPDTPVYIGLVTPQKQHCELVVAPFSQDWNYLASVTVTMRDRPGVVSRLATAFAALGINIETQESASVNHLDEHFVSLLVDFSSSPQLSALPRDTPAPVQRLYRSFESLFSLHDYRFIHLFESIMTRCADVIVWHEISGQCLPSVSITALPVRPLGQRSNSVVSRAPGPLQAKVVIPDDIAVTLRAALEVDDELQYISISDTDTRSLRVFFLHPSTVGSLFHIGVYHDSVPGALAAILTLLREAGFSLLTSLTRKQSKGRSVWEALVQYVGENVEIPAPEGRVAHSPPSPADLLWVEQRLNEAAPKVGNFAKYSVALGSPQYPKRGPAPTRPVEPGTSLHDHPEPVKIVSGPHQPESQRMEVPSVATLIAQRRAQLETEDIDADVRVRIDELLTTILRRSESGARPIVFVSFPLAANRQGMVTKLIVRLEEWYEVWCYDKPDGKMVLAEAIRLIEESDYFVGIWHPDSAPKHRIRKSKDLSPWMPFEYGVARAQSKPNHIVHSDQLDESVWRRIDPGVAIPEYTTESFVDETIPKIVAYCRANFR
jgi:hypothetical protein